MLHDTKAKFECDDCATTVEIDPRRVDGLLGLPEGWAEVSVRSTGPSAKTVTMFQVMNFIRTQGESMGLPEEAMEETLALLTPDVVYEAVEKVLHYCPECVADFSVDPIRDDVRECSEKSKQKWTAITTNAITLEDLAGFVGETEEDDE